MYFIKNIAIIKQKKDINIEKRMNLNVHGIDLICKS